MKNGISLGTVKMQKLTSNYRLSEKLNIIRAGVLGANDGIISVAGIVLGVAGANQGQMALLIAGLSGMFAGAFSMAGGEYVSVSTQRDTQKTMTRLQETTLNEHREEETDRLTQKYINEGLSPELASQCSKELMKSHGLETTLRSKYNIELHHYFNPWHAAICSFFSFICGAVLPLISITLIPDPYKIVGTMFAMILALMGTGYISSKLGHNNSLKFIIRNVITGSLTMLITYLIGGTLG
ncbi:VIT1/CCC1 transporter family protein [Companilactobacillus kedongensis]|uniref:VIT1/CCC1 transporter family protein n=1 Tax=Companilactobacillus kedongensis TaxID=2486004 RepID=UPI001CDB93CF|nr:VIT family protein [Companilactobacillus kedongensis]